MNKYSFYLNVILKSFKIQYIYLSQVFSKILFCILSYLIQMYIWKSVTASSSNFALNFGYMNRYILVSSLIGVFIAFDMSYIPIIEEKVKRGEIAIELSKPYNYIVYLFCEYLGKCMFKFFFNAIPLFLLMTAIGNVFNFKFIDLLCFIPSLILAILMFFLLSVLFGFLSLLFVHVGNLHIIIDSSITLFSGSMIPLEMIPDRFKFIYELLPFQYFFYYPISIFLGRLSSSHILRVYLSQIVWILILILLTRFLYYYGQKRLQDFGG